MWKSVRLLDVRCFSWYHAKFFPLYPPTHVWKSCFFLQERHLTTGHLPPTFTTVSVPKQNRLYLTVKWWVMIPSRKYTCKKVESKYLILSLSRPGILGRKSIIVSNNFLTDSTSSISPRTLNCNRVWWSSMSYTTTVRFLHSVLYLNATHCLESSSRRERATYSWQKLFRLTRIKR